MYTPVIFDNEIGSAGSDGLDGMIVDNIKPEGDRFVFPDIHRVVLLASGRLLNWGILPAQHNSCRYWEKNKACKTGVYLLPLHLDEKVAKLKPSCARCGAQRLRLWCPLRLHSMTPPTSLASDCSYMLRNMVQMDRGSANNVAPRTQDTSCKT